MTIPNPPTAGASSRLLGIQMGRGVAALLVVLVHASHGVALPQYTGQIPFGGFFEFGHSGVDFFFVLSGFIIFSVHRGDVGVPAALGRYVRRRLTRILPVYWVVMVLVLLLAVLKPGGPDLPGAWRVLASVLLLPQSAEPMLGPSWTLVHEMMFYGLFALAIVSRRLGAGVLMLWLAAILLGRFVGSDIPVLRVLMAPFNLEFVLGIAVAQMTMRVAVPWPRLLALAGALVFLATGMAENAAMMPKEGDVAELLFGSASAAIIAGLATAERQGRLRIGAAGAFLGDASYAIYLIHVIAVGLTARVLANLGIVKLLPGNLVFGIAVLAAVLAGAGLHVLVERPLLRWLGRIGRPAHRAAAAAT